MRSGQSKAHKSTHPQRVCIHLYYTFVYKCMLRPSPLGPAQPTCSRTCCLNSASPSANPPPWGPSSATPTSRLCCPSARRVIMLSGPMADTSARSGASSESSAATTSDGDADAPACARNGFGRLCGGCLGMEGLCLWFQPFGVGGSMHASMQRNAAQRVVRGAGAFVLKGSNRHPTAAGLAMGSRRHLASPSPLPPLPKHPPP